MLTSTKLDRAAAMSEVTLSLFTLIFMLGCCKLHFGCDSSSMINWRSMADILSRFTRLYPSKQFIFQETCYH